MIKKLVNEKASTFENYSYGKLDLSHSELTEPQFAALCETLKKIPIIHELDVRGNHFGFDSAVSLLQLMQWQLRDAYEYNATYCPLCLERCVPSNYYHTLLDAPPLFYTYVQTMKFTSS